MRRRGSWPLTQRFEDALVYATQAHAGAFRKETTVPYVSHLLAMVLESGGTEDQGIAALLHDAVEDAGGKGRLADIRARFGERVAEIAALAAITPIRRNNSTAWREEAW